MNNNENLLSMEDVIEADIYNFTKRAVGELKLDGAYVNKAIGCCGLHKPCILAYLFAVYLELEDEYILLLQDIKNSKKIADDEFVWKKLEKDKDISTLPFARVQWQWVVREREKLKSGLKGVMKDFNNNLSKGPSF